MIFLINNTRHITIIYFYKNYWIEEVQVLFASKRKLLLLLFYLEGDCLVPLPPSEPLSFGELNLISSSLNTCYLFFCKLSFFFSLPLECDEIRDSSDKFKLFYQLLFKSALFFCISNCLWFFTISCSIWLILSLNTSITLSDNYYYC